ncbi:ribonuclease H-like domain-containing protein [Crocinitomix catalasitica]|uniref:ribonuclease H-like domain-containing protein n=1 Tax=Crocinitomix catalasitica TaxID=184607 RepID=UPI0004886CE8|nr:ribonuclease H-like domain-containing protein [Crocinitomix catalasitica]
MQLRKINIEKVLFLDIETVPEVYNFSDLDDETAALYTHKTKFFQKDGLTAEDVYDRAGVYAEFGKIVCISCGIVQDKPEGRTIRMKSFAGDDEKLLLEEFAELLNKHYNSPYHILCGHNAKEFDFPFLGRRMLIHGIDLPAALDIAGKKPWEINHLDTMELWKLGDYKHYTSMSLLCHIFKVPTPKDDISGADVARVYYEENDLARIVTYCQKDVIALIQLFLRFRNDPLVLEENIID